MKHKWIELMNSLGIDENIQEFDKISSLYGEEHRSYHNLAHIEDCLLKSELCPLSRDIDILSCAIWFHDVIYDPQKVDNEQESALVAEKFLKSQSINTNFISRVGEVIMSTLHRVPPKNDVEAYMMDIDVSILGAPEVQYSAYCHNIRQEYKSVPWTVYVENRIKILKMFLKRKDIYFTPNFNNRLGSNARINIEKEINILEND